MYSTNYCGSIGSLHKNLVPGLACLGGVVPRAQPAHQLRGAAPLAAGHGLGGPHGARVPRGHRRRGLHAPRPRRPRHRALPGQTQQGDRGLRVSGNLIITIVTCPRSPRLLPAAGRAAVCVGPPDRRLHVQRPGPLRPGRGHRVLARLRRHARGGRQVSEDLGEVSAYFYQVETCY